MAGPASPLLATTRITSRVDMPPSNSSCGHTAAAAAALEVAVPSCRSNISKAPGAQ